MKTKLLLPALLLLAPCGARAEFSFACGHDREKGAEHAEISFVDSLEAPMKLLLDGQEVAEDLLGFKALDGGRWIVSVDRGEGKGSRKFVFSQKPAYVQESSVDVEGREKKAGPRRPCVFVQKH